MLPSAAYADRLLGQYVKVGAVESVAAEKNKYWIVLSFENFQAFLKYNATFWTFFQFIYEIGYLKKVSFESLNPLVYLQLRCVSFGICDVIKQNQSKLEINSDLNIESNQAENVFSFLFCFWHPSTAHIFGTTNSMGFTAKCTC